MHGLQLASMEASDMLDVVHYFLEEDFRYSSESESVYKDVFRKHIFKEFYNTEYEFAQKQEDYGYGNPMDSSIEDDELSLPNREERIQPFNPRATRVKEYFEPTPISDNENESPFGNILDPPIG